MIDFACKQFNLEDIIKCGLGLTKAEYKIFNYFLKNIDKKCTTHTIAKKLDLNITTIQKAVKKLSEHLVIIKHQKNLKNGGYLFTYECNSKSNIRKIIKNIIRNWSNNVENKIDNW